MTTAFLTHADCLNHLMPPGHPEQVARLQAILARLSAPEFDELLRVDAPLGRDEHILLVHPAAHLQALKAAAPSSGSRALDPDTHMSPGTLNAARRGVGANIKAVDMVLGGEVQNAFCAVRPPGHHAEATTPMGFCLFGNVVIAAKHAMQAHGLVRVAIVDFDVHHGNGTQDLVWNDAGIFFASSHQMPLYPGSGAPSEVGGHDNVLNVPLATGTGSAVFRRKFENEILPAVAAHDPQLILISAGFDAHMADPLASLDLTTADFGWATGVICKLANELCQGRVVSTLEGGYDLEALAASTAAHVRVLMEQGR
jgi:acetoin utilization deacetylase AcuC-like enzyme